jgi:hypothetical protein
MYRKFAIVQSVIWFDNSSTEQFYILEQIRGWTHSHTSICAGPFNSSTEALAYAEDNFQQSE